MNLIGKVVLDDCSMHLLRRLCSRKAACKGKGNVLLIEDEMEAAEIRKCTDAILHTCGGVAALFAGNDADGYKYAIGELDGNVREIVKQVNKELDGRGGGKPFFAQGSVKARRKQIEELFRKLQFK